MLSNKTKLSKDHQDTTPTKVPLCPLGWKTAPSASSFAHVHTRTSITSSRTIHISSSSCAKTNSQVQGNKQHAKRDRILKTHTLTVHTGADAFVSMTQHNL